MINKQIYLYTNVELLDVIKNSSNKSIVSKAKNEFKKRSLTEDKIRQVEIDYINYKEFQNKRKTDTLTREEWFTFFFFPVFTPKSNRQNDHFSESELNRFKTHGFEKKLKQADKVKSFGCIFWFLILLIAILLHSIYKLI